MITATLTWKGQKYSVDYIESVDFGSVKLFRVEVTDGFEPFTRQTHGGPANYATGTVSRRCLSNIQVDGIPAQQYIWKRNARERAKRAGIHRTQTSTPVSVGVS